MIGRTFVSLTTSAMIVGAQQTVRIEVRDDAGMPVPYALVAPMNGASQVANDSGVVSFRMKAADSLNLRVRRIGYREQFGWVVRIGENLYRVTLPRVAAVLGTVDVTAPGSASNTPLAQRGFYDRLDRVQRGAILGDFLTPEELDVRAAATVTRMLAGSRYAKVTTMPSSRGRGTLVVVGRAGCPMTILLDGQVVRGTVQDVAVSETPTSINPGGTRQTGVSFNDTTTSIDDVVDGRSVMAIEVYPSTANAPAELQRLSGRGSCGIVALWTGARR
ncbi:MAG: hypothetical protein K8S21_01220 [Gemmatimonadetes bacterium]|nr:hypothetical protein [Gemmatimonadota bacterium]